MDNSSANLLYHLIKGLHHSPVIIIGLYRSRDINIVIDQEKHPLAKLITEMEIKNRNIFINLDMFNKAERRAFMDDMLDSETNLYDSIFRENLFDRTNGNPLFVSELINLLKETGLIVKNHDNAWINKTLIDWNIYPLGREGIIGERLENLEESLASVLSYAGARSCSFIAQALLKTMDKSERDLLIKFLNNPPQKQYTQST